MYNSVKDCMKRYDKVLRISLLILKIARNLKKYNYCAYFKRFTFSMADSLQFCNNCILLYGKKKVSLCKKRSWLWITSEDIVLKLKVAEWQKIILKEYEYLAYNYALLIRSLSLMIHPFQRPQKKCWTLLIY